MLSSWAGAQRKVREKRQKRGKTIEKQTKKKSVGGGKTKRGEFSDSGELHLFHLNSEQNLRVDYFVFSEQQRRFVSYSDLRWKECSTPTGAESCWCELWRSFFCHDSIIEGHSFTITVGLWVSADIITVALWPVAGERRQEFAAYSTNFKGFSSLLFIPMEALRSQICDFYVILWAWDLILNHKLSILQSQATYYIILLYYRIVIVCVR